MSGATAREKEEVGREETENFRRKGGGGRKRAARRRLLLFAPVEGGREAAIARGRSLKGGGNGKSTEF